MAVVEQSFLKLERKMGKIQKYDLVSGDYPRNTSMTAKAHSGEGGVGALK